LAILASLSHVDVGEKATVKAAELLDRAKPPGTRSHAWSIAELGLDQTDYEWLLRWARAQRAALAHRLLESWDRASLGERSVQLRVAAGLVWFAVFSEIGRREARAGHLWAPILKTLYGDGESAPSSLFVNGQPTVALKDALEAAAREFGLRNVFGQDGLQNWYDSIYLQFGFAQRDFDGKGGGRLGAWLAGVAKTFPLATLLEDPELKSKQLVELWQSLIAFRRRNSSRTDCERALKSSPWLLSEWVEPLLIAVEASRERPDEVTSDEGLGEEPTSFLEPPTLQWQTRGSGHLYFRTAVENLAQLSLDPGPYEVVVEGKEVARLQIGRDGEVAVDAATSEGDIFCEPGAPSATAVLHSSDGRIKSIQELRLWDDDEVSLFEVATRQQDGVLLGRKLTDACSPVLHPRRGYIIIASADLTPDFEYLLFESLGEWTAYYVQQGWQSERLTLRLDGEVLWKGRTDKKQASESQPYWISDIKLQVPPEPVRLGEGFSIRVRHPKNVAIVDARIHGQPSLAVKRRSDVVTKLVGLTMKPQTAGSPLSIRLSARRGGQSALVWRTPQLKAEGLARLTRDGWEVVKPEDTLDVAADGSAPLKVVLSDGDASGHGWGLLEGDVYLRRVSGVARPLGDLVIGLGGQLSAKPGPFNSPVEPTRLAAAVVDRGNLPSLKPAIRGMPRGGAELWFGATVEPDLDHRVLWWDVDGALHVFCPQLEGGNGTRGVGRWVFEGEVGEPLAVGVSYRGQRVAAWWTDRWIDLLVDALEKEPLAAALALRWLLLPVLQADVPRRLREYAAAHPSVTARAWLVDDWRRDKLPDTLKPLLSDASSVLPLPAQERWDTALRSIFGEADLPGWVLEEMFKSARPDSAQGADELESVYTSLIRLSRVHPFLSASCLRSYIEGPNVERRSVPWSLKLLYAGLLGMDRAAATSSNWHEITQWDRKGLVERAAAELRGVDTTFVERTVSRATEAWANGSWLQAEEVTRTNFRLMLAGSSFRQLVTADLVHRLIEEWGESR